MFPLRVTQFVVLSCILEEEIVGGPRRGVDLGVAGSSLPHFRRSTNVDLLMAYVRSAWLTGLLWVEGGSSRISQSPMWSFLPRRTVEA